METAIIRVLTYFSHFSYAPSFDEIYIFLPIKTTEQQLRRKLVIMVKYGLLLKQYLSLPTICNFSISTCNSTVYTLPPYRIFFDKRITRAGTSQKKIEKALSLIHLFARIPYVRMIGISGGLSMMNAGASDDIDFFIITSAHRLWTARLCILGAAELFGVRRKRLCRRVKDSFCFNLLFDETNLVVPGQKQNLYVAHEIVQMKPMMIKNDTYTGFLKANQWVRDFFPNINISNNYEKHTNYRGGLLEFLCKKLQLFLINKHKTNEHITETQLWFFPHDFEKKLKQKGLI